MENSTIPFPSSQPSEATHENDVDGLAKRIQAAHSAFEAAHRMCLDRARECGQLLIAAKALHKHGGWLAWLKANFPFTPRTAQHYIKIAQRWDDVVAKCETVSYLTLRMAIESLKERPPAGPTQVVYTPPRASNEADPFQTFWRRLVAEEPKWRRRYERLQAQRKIAEDLAAQLKDLRAREHRESTKAEKIEEKLTRDLDEEFRRREQDSDQEPEAGAWNPDAEATMPCTA